MSVDALTVLVGDRVAGTLTRARGGKLSFEYDESYRERNDATPLSVSLPLELRGHDDRVRSTLARYRLV